MAQGIFDEQDEIRQENAEHAGEILMLIDYLHNLPQRIDIRLPGKEKTHYDEYRAIFTDAQRKMVIDALRRLP